MPSKQSERRQRAKVRAALFNGEPWSILPSAFAGMVEAVDGDDGRDLQSAFLGYGPDVELEGGKVIGSTMVIPITAVLQENVDFMVRLGYASSYQAIESALKLAMGNEAVKSVLLYCDSPGGSAIGCQRVANLVSSLKETKPIHAYVQGVCASACYYIAAAATSISATPDSMIGSIGTIYPHLEYSEYLKEIGFKFTVFTNSDSGKKKHGNAYEPLSEESTRTLQDFVDSYGESFISDVANFRNVDAKVVIERFGSGDVMRADRAVSVGMIDRVVGSFNEAMAAFGQASPPQSGMGNVAPPEQKNERKEVTMNERIKAQLVAFGLIDSLEASDAECSIALRSFFHARNQAMPEGDDKILAALQSPVAESTPAPAATPATPAPADDSPAPAARNEEQQSARIADLEASAKCVNAATGETTITDAMVLAAAKTDAPVTEIVNGWTAKIAEGNEPAPSARVLSEGRDRFAQDAVAALVAKSLGDSYQSAVDDPRIPLDALTDNQTDLLGLPLWAIAQRSLKASGVDFDEYGDRELMAEEAMRQGLNDRHVFFSEGEGRQYGVRNAGAGNRPGDFPNILSSLANKFLDVITLDDDYSYGLVSAVMPGGMRDFKPEPLINKGIVEELEEIEDAGEIEGLGLEEEVLSYLFLRRFANKWGWTPVMVANDDLGAFVEGMIGLREAWEVTQNRLVVERFTTTEDLLDGSNLFANRADVGSATNNNARTGGGVPSDAEWAAMEELYADIGGVATGRRVRGSLNVCFTPTGTAHQNAMRTFDANYRAEKQATTDANIGIYRGRVAVVPESELRGSSSTTWFALRSPTQLRTATVIRAYFNGYGRAGRRERWYDPTNKTTYVSLEGRVAVATKNWRYAVRNVT